LQADFEGPTLIFGEAPLPLQLQRAAFTAHNNVVLTIPSGMAQTLLLFHRWSPMSFGEDSENHRNRRIGQTLVSPPA